MVVCMGYMVIYLLGASYGTLGSFFVSLVSIVGETSNIGDLFTTWEDDCNHSSAATSMVVHLWIFLLILINSKFGNSVPNSKNYTEEKRGESLEKVYKIWRYRLFVQILFFMDLINTFGVSGDFIGYTNMHNPHIFTFGNTKLQYMSATTQFGTKENQWAEP